MVNHVPIEVEQFNLNIMELWKRGLVLTAGVNEPGQFNPMTIGWGSIGWMWQKPVIQVAVRPTRHTYHLIERYDSFTVCALPEQYKNILTLWGTRSGRDMDKFQESGLTLLPSTHIAAPGYAEAELILECRKIYNDNLQPELFLGSHVNVDGFYPKKDFHRVYYGEIVKVFGIEKYSRPY